MIKVVIINGKTQWDELCSIGKKPKIDFTQTKKLFQH